MMGGKERKAGRPRDPRLDASIVEATIELLESRGYNEMSLAAVAERAGTTTVAIYRRWSSKADLVADAVFRTDGDDVVAETDDVAADISTMVHWAVDKICRPAALAAVAGLLGESRSERAVRGASAALASRRVEARLERAKATGELRADVDTRVLSAMVAGPVIFASFVGDAAQVDEAWIHNLVSIVLDGSRPRSDGGSEP